MTSTNDPELQALLSRYKAMDSDEFEALCLRAAQNPDSMTATASLALMEAATQRGTTFAEAVARAVEDREADRRLMKAMAHAEQAKKDKDLNQLEGVMGWAGVLLSPIVLIPSIDAGHTGGTIAGLAMLGFSCWNIYSSKAKKKR